MGKYFNKTASTRLIREALKGKFINNPQYSSKIQKLFMSGQMKNEIGQWLARDIAVSKKDIASAQTFINSLKDGIKSYKRDMKAEPDLKGAIKPLIKTDRGILKQEKLFLSKLQKMDRKSQRHDLENGKEWGKAHSKILKKVIK